MFKINIVVILVLITIGYSSERFPIGELKTDIINQMPRRHAQEGLNNLKRPFSRTDLMDKHRLQFDKENQGIVGNNWQFEHQKPSPPIMSNKQMLDSGWANHSRGVFTYDTNGNKVQSLEQFWRDSAWKDKYRYIDTYDGDGNRTERISQGWNSNESTWHYFWKYSYTYDGIGKMIGFIQQYWENNTWENRWNYFFTYDSGGNLTEELRQVWDDNSWENRWKYTCTYDANGNLMKELLQSDFGHGWANDQRWTYTYDSNGNTTNELLQCWGNYAWENRWEITYTYNADGNMIEELIEGIGWPLDYWRNISKYTYIYDANGNMIGWLQQDWDLYVNDWRNRYYWTIEYNTEGYVATEIIPYGDCMGSVPQKNTYLYDLNWNTIEIIHQWNYDYTGLAVEKDVSLHPKEYSVTQNFPNPFNPITTIQYRLPERADVQITVYDLLGKEVTTLVSETQDAGFKSVQWKATNIPSGMYFYQIRAGDFVQTRKMILLK